MDHDLNTKALSDAIQALEARAEWRQQQETHLMVAAQNTSRETKLRILLAQLQTALTPYEDHILYDVTVPPRSQTFSIRLWWTDDMQVRSIPTVAIAIAERRFSPHVWVYLMGNSQRVKVYVQNSPDSVDYRDPETWNLKNYTTFAEYLWNPEEVHFNISESEILAALTRCVYHSQKASSSRFKSVESELQEPIDALRGRINRRFFATALMMSVSMWAGLHCIRLAYSGSILDLTSVGFGIFGALLIPRVGFLFDYWTSE